MTTASNRNHFLIQGSILAIASIIVRLIGLVYRIPMQRLIGIEGMGYYSFAFEIYNNALILSSYGLPIAVSKLVAAKRIRKEYKNEHRIFICSLVIAVIVGLIAFSILFFGAEFLSKLLANDVSAAIPLRVLSPTVLVFSIMGVFRGYYQGKNTMVPTAISQVLEQIINAIVSVAAAYFLIRNFSASVNVAAYGAAGGTLGTLSGALIGLLFLLLVYGLNRSMIIKKINNDNTRYPDSYIDISKIIILTILPIILSQTVYHISGLIDNSMFAHIMANKEVTNFDKEVITNVIDGQLYTKDVRGMLIGIYSNEYRLLTNVPVAIASAIGAAIITSITAARIRGMNGVIRRKTHVAIKFNMIIAIPSAVGMAVLASPILQLLFHDSSKLSANFMRFGSIAVILFSFSTVTTAILQGINRLKTPVINSAISLGIHIVLVFLLLKLTSMSTYALVIGNVIFALIVCVLNWIALVRYLEYRQEILRTFIVPLASAGLMGVAVYFTYKGLMLALNSNLISTLICIFEAVIIYFVLLILMKGIDEDELESLPKGERILRLLQKLHLL